MSKTHRYISLAFALAGSAPLSLGCDDIEVSKSGRVATVEIDDREDHPEDASESSDEAEEHTIPRAPSTLASEAPDPAEKFFEPNEDSAGGGPISCSSKDGSMDCYFTSGGCCRTLTKCWNC